MKFKLLLILFTALNIFKDSHDWGAKLCSSLKVFRLRYIPGSSSEGNCKIVTPVPWKWPAAVTNKLFLSKLSSTNIVKIPLLEVDGSGLSPESL